MISPSVETCSIAQFGVVFFDNGLWREVVVSWRLITMIVITNHNHYSGSEQRRRSSSIVENDYEDAVDNAEEVEDDYEEEYDQKKQLLDGNDTFLPIVQIN